MCIDACIGACTEMRRAHAKKNRFQNGSPRDVHTQFGKKSKKKYAILTLLRIAMECVHGRFSLCTDMRVGMCADMHTGVCIDRCANMHQAMTT